MTRFVGTKVEFGADKDEFALNLDARELPLTHADTYLNDLLLKYCEAALADRRGNRKLHISKIAWLLGFNEVSAFTHTFKRWTGKTPSQMRATAASSDFVQGG